MKRTVSPKLLPLIGALACSGCASGPAMGFATSNTAQLSPPPRELATASAAQRPLRPPAERAGYGTDWCFDTGAPIAGPPALGPEGQLYAATHEGYVHALNRDGAFRWSYTVKGSVIGGPELLPSGSVVVGTSSQLLYALTPGGLRHWVFRVPEPISTGLSVSRKGTIVFGAGDRILYAISPYGGLMWRIPVKGGFTTTPLVVADGLVALGTSGGVLLVRGPNRQKLVQAAGIRQVTAGPASVGFGFALGNTGVIGLSGSAFTIPGLERLRFDSERAQLLGVTQSEALWLEADGRVARRVALAAAPSDAAALDARGTAYVPTNDGRLLAAGPSDDTFQEFARLGSSPLSAPLVDEALGRVVASAGEGRVCATSVLDVQ